MTETELKTLVENIVAKHFDEITMEGIFRNVEDAEFQASFALLSTGIYDSILANTHLRAKLPTANKAEVEKYIREFLIESERMTRDKKGIPYRE